MRERLGIIEDLCAFASALFCDVNVEQVLEGHLYFDSVSCRDAADLLFKRQKRYQSCSKLECENIADSVSRYLCDRDAQRMRTSTHGVLHVFELLSDLVDLLLVQENGEMLCRYEHILYWRELVQSMGEELPVSAMYAIKDMEYGRPSREQFEWDFVLGQNNAPLNRLMQRGISEHHMHLWASVPYFQVSWLNMMNNPAYSPYIRNFDRIDCEDWGLDQDWNQQENPPVRQCGSSLAVMCRQAALIRVYLCARLKKLLLRMDPLGSIFTFPEQEDDLTYILRLLRDPQKLLLEMDHIQAIISSLRNPGGVPCLDYALHLFSSQQFRIREEDQVFSGERWFLYTMLRDIYGTFSTLNQEEQNLFYAYLLLRTQIRAKMVQADDKVGFDHFQVIQNRKGYFLGDRYSTELIMRLAVRNPLKKIPHLSEIEARIVPRDTPEHICKDVSQLESTLFEDSVWDMLEGRGSADPAGIKGRYYYVFHFTKERDTTQISDFGLYSFAYRHFRFRKKLEKKAWAIKLFRENYPKLAGRVLGIDACSQEIGCRPENFAFIFRMLSNHVCEFEEGRLPPLRKTYHVGEDFLDLADGLRAIDEAIRFLNLGCGDRLGHALALSIEPRDWYKKKNQQISLPKQDYLDNVAWLYLAIRRYQLPVMESAVLFLKTQFEYYFRQVYLNCIDAQDVKMFVKSGEQCYREKQFARNYKPHPLSFTIEDYCRAWMLRGDHPELYECGYFCEHELLPDDWAQFKNNSSYPADPSIRYIPECSFLNFCYHYHSEIRKTGAELITIVVGEEYLKAVEAVQKALQFDIANRGISIECNPTSNIKISTFRSYKEHPITRLYNKGLVHSKEELRQCPQISVSINTDDSGVFFTSLESEYAVMARALETLQKNGQPLYYKWEIYDWLDKVRKMGNEQSFQRN